MLDLAIIGSGYAGATIAARMAPHANVLIVERGRWWRPGDFPNGLVGLARAYLSRRNPTGLWSMRFGEGTGNAFVSAFGGASVVNYGITSRPERHAFDGWPVTADELAPYFDRALGVLAPSHNPIGDSLGDKQFLDMVEPGRRVDLENTIDWTKCDNCGRCVPGCNKGYKRSLDMTYLADAMKAGAEVSLETTVVSIDRDDDDGCWALALEPTGGGPRRVVRARQVVVAAGTLGTLELMRRCGADIPVSATFGTNLSMNGDGLGFLYNVPNTLSSHHGAPISTSVRLHFDDDSGRRRTLMVMSGRVPKAAMQFSATALAALLDLVCDHDQAPSPDSNAMKARAWMRRLADFGPVRARGAFSHSFMFKLDGQDASRGMARFAPDGSASIDWADYADDPVMRFAGERLSLWAAKMGGTVVPNVALLPGMRSFSVHPLGGCRMGRDVDEGVVDSVGRVYRPDGGFYEGLRIADASIIPGSLGVPPSLTVTALAERIAEDLIRSRPATAA